MDDFFKKYQNKISNNSKISVQNGECLLWTRATKPSGYGVIRYMSPITNKWQTANAHRLSYIVFNRNFQLGDLEVSHLCHNYKCTNVKHLSAEPHSINTDRSKCLSRGVCHHHDPFPNCMLSMKISGISKTITES